VVFANGTISDAEGRLVATASRSLLVLSSPRRRPRDDLAGSHL